MDTEHDGKNSQEVEVNNVDDESTTNGIDEEVRATEKVVNAFLYYQQYGQLKVLELKNQFNRIPIEHQSLIGESYRAHINNIKERADHNHSVIRMMVNYGCGMFGEESMKALRIHQLRRPTLDYMSKVLSTIRQICREWSAEGEQERIATYAPVIEELNSIFPKERSRRHNVRILVPGCGLGRLAYDLINEGYTVQGNEFSLFMLMTSCFILNACKEENQFTLYPFIFDKSNSWDYADQVRPITFPDKCPNGDQESRLNSFSMGAGDFMEVTRNASFDVIVTTWFIDTAHNVIDYIDRIYETLESNGVWINVGPLTYHYEDMRSENSIELPYSEIMKLVLAKGFTITSEKQIQSKYTTNRKSMLQNEYSCAYFCARKLSEERS